MKGLSSECNVTFTGNLLTALQAESNEGWQDRNGLGKLFLHTSLLLKFPSMTT